MRNNKSYILNFSADLVLKFSTEINISFKFPIKQKLFAFFDRLPCSMLP